MVNILGANLPDISITGGLSNSWIYILLIFVIGIALIGFIVIFLHYKTWNKKIEFYENVGGRGYQKIATRRARMIRVGEGGTEVLKPKSYPGYLPAYGQKMGRNLYWFAKGIDGYWYNVILGDLDSKLNMLDVEPVDRDVRMFHVAMDRITTHQYGEKKSGMEKYAPYMFLFLFLVLLVGSMWIIIGRVGDSTNALANTAETNMKVAELLKDILQGTDNIANHQGGTSSSGLIPANITT